MTSEDKNCASRSFKGVVKLNNLICFLCYLYMHLCICYFKINSLVPYLENSTATEMLTCYSYRKKVTIIQQCEKKLFYVAKLFVCRRTKCWGGGVKVPNSPL